MGVRHGSYFYYIYKGHIVMKEHIKKFRSIAAADGHIIDAPFISAIHQEQGDPILVRCNEEDKKLKVAGGQISVVDAVELISFTVIREATGEEWSFQCEEGMTWDDMANSEIYNPDGTIRRGTGDWHWMDDPNAMYIGGCSLYDPTEGEWGDSADPEDVIKPVQYTCYGPND